MAVRDLYRRNYAAIAGGLSEQAWWYSEDSEKDLITHAFALTDNFGLPSRVSNAARFLGYMSGEESGDASDNYVRPDYVFKNLRGQG